MLGLRDSNHRQRKWWFHSKATFACVGLVIKLAPCIKFHILLVSETVSPSFKFSFVVPWCTCWPCCPPCWWRCPPCASPRPWWPPRDSGDSGSSWSWRPLPRVSGPAPSLSPPLLDADWLPLSPLRRYWHSPGYAPSSAWKYSLILGNKIFIVFGYKIFSDYGQTRWERLIKFKFAFI